MNVDVVPQPTLTRDDPFKQLFELPTTRSMAAEVVRLPDDYRFENAACCHACRRYAAGAPETSALFVVALCALAFFMAFVCQATDWCHFSDSQQ